MATLLMRTPELAVAEKLSLASMEHARLQTERALIHGEHEGQHKTSAEGRGRARKGKNGQKKLPQRGLGVAQLEKLRLQEQSKQEAACLASLQSLPPFRFPDQHGGICFRHMKGAISHHSGHMNALSFCNGRPGAPDKQLDYLPGEGRQFGKRTVDGDVFRTIMSLATCGHSNAGSLPRRSQGPSMSTLPPAQHKEDSEPSYAGNALQTVSSMTSLTETTPGSKGQASCGNSPRSSKESPDRLTSCAFGCRGSPPKSTAQSPLAFSSPSAPSRINSVDSQASIADEEEKRAAEADRAKETARPAFPVANGGVVEAGVINPKLLPQAVGKDGAGALFTLTNLQGFESSLGPASVRRLPRERTDVPVVGVAANCDRPKELSSFQSFSSNQTWSDIEKTCGRKRPWYALKESTGKLLHSESLDLNAPAGETEVAHKECRSAGVAQGHQQGPVGAHYTTGIIRSALGNSLKIKACATWQENEAPISHAGRDAGFYSMESLPKGHCTPQTKIKDSCSSVCSPSALTLNRRRCLSSPEVPVLAGMESGDFLTLGLSSGSYPMSPQLEVEVDSQETPTSEEVHRVKRVAMHPNEDDDDLQLQMCNPHQELAVAVKGGPHSPPYAGTKFFSAMGEEFPLLSCRLSSFSSSNVMEYCHKPSGRLKEEESLDLRLKLAL